MTLFFVGPPEYVAGPVNGHLYAQVDKAFIKKVRSLSLDSGSPVSIGAENSHFFENKANTLTRRHAHGFKNGDITTADVKLSQPRLQYTPDSMQNSTEGEVVSDEVKSIDRLLLELGECSDILDSTIQQAKPITRDSAVSAPGVPVRNTSFNAGMRYQRNNGVPVVSQGQHLSRSTPNRSPVTSTAFSQSYSWTSNQRTEKKPNGIFGESPSFVLHEAPISQTSPPLSPQTSPKFYATQIAPRTFKATTYTHTTVGYNPYRSPGNGDTSSGGFVTNGVLSIADDWTSSHPGKQRRGPQVLDFNNNKSPNGVELFDFDQRKDIEDAGTLPEKGNVASKVALLTDMFQADKVQPGHHQNLRCQIIPMPGLTSVSPSEVFKEISNYNAQSLAPGELSHSTGTLYSSKSPPKKIVEPSKNVQPEEPPPPEIDIMAVKGSLKHVAPALEYRSHDQKPGTSCFSLVTLCIRYHPS